MGILHISDELDEQFENAEVGASRLEPDTYDGAITGIKIVSGAHDTWKPWVEAALQVTFTVEDAGSVTEQYELAPLTNKDGDISPGKLKFLKWQLASLGYEGKLKDLEQAILRGEFHGNMVNFEVKETEGSVNPNTGKPYIRREVVAKNFVEKGLGGMDLSSLAGTFDGVIV